MRKTKPWEERYWSKVKKSESCWIWQGTLMSLKSNKYPYGRFFINGVTDYAHRISVKLSGREIPLGMHVDHLCRVHSCVNPDHLEVVTVKENVLRGQTPIVQSLRNAHLTHCKSGHEFTEDNTRFYKGARSGKTHRRCRTCSRIRTANSRAKIKIRRDSGILG